MNLQCCTAAPLQLLLTSLTRPNKRYRMEHYTTTTQAIQLEKFNNNPLMQADFENFCSTI
jgi:hypothetical protein